MSISRRYTRLPVLALLLVLVTSCSAADLFGIPASQSWLLIDNENNLGRITTTYLTVLNGGATSQGAGVYRQDVTASCSFTVPLSGNWNGKLMHMTSTGGACGVGYILTMDGNTNADYGTADAMTGTYRITYNGAWSGGENGTWRATLSH